MKKKRIIAYIIDIVIVMGVLYFISLFLPSTIDETHLTDLNEKYVNQEIKFDDYIDKYIDINHNIAKNHFGFNVFSLVITMVYFIAVPYVNKGRTFGKQIMKIRIKRVDDKPLEVYDLASRSVLIDGVGYLLFLVILVHILPSTAYFWVENILGFGQILIVIISGFMVLYKKNDFGLHDILTKTMVGDD